MKKFIIFFFFLFSVINAHADNFTFSQGSGKTAGSDTISSIDYPRHKLIIGADGTNDGDVSSANPLPAYAAASVNGGYTPGTLLSAATTNATSVKASAGKLGFLTASNINAAARYLKFYNKASAPTVGTDVPIYTFLIPGNTAGAGTNIPIPSEGLTFSTGIAFAITTGATTADTGAVAVNELIINYGYK